MNRIEKALMHALFIHLHHNIYKAINFKAIDALNKKVSKTFPKALIVGPGDDAAATRAGGAMRDAVAVIPNHPSQADMEELYMGS